MVHPEFFQRWGLFGSRGRGSVPFRPNAVIEFDELTLINFNFWPFQNSEKEVGGVGGGGPGAFSYRSDHNFCRVWCIIYPRGVVISV